MAVVAARPVAIIAPGEVFGGAERHLLVLAEQLRYLERPFTLYLLYDGPLAELARQRGLPVNVIGSGHSFDIGALWRLAGELMRAPEVRVLHAHGYKAVAICGVVALLRRCRIIKTEHGMPENASWGGKARLLSHGYRLLENALGRWNSVFIVYVTRDLQALCAKEHSWARTQVIYNGIDVIESESLPRPDAYRADSFHVAVIGRLEPVKGIDHAIRAWTLREMPANARLHVIGEGPLEAELKALSAQSGLEDRVTFHGFRQDVLAYVKHADAILMPSLHEGLPYTLLEALRAARPVVAAKTGGLEEVLEDEVTALLVSTRSASEIAASISRLAGDATLRERIARAGHALLLERFSARAMTNSYCELYDAH